VLYTLLLLPYTSISTYLSILGDTGLSGAASELILSGLNMKSRIIIIITIPAGHDGRRCRFANNIRRLDWSSATSTLRYVGLQRWRFVLLSRRIWSGLQRAYRGSGEGTWLGRGNELCGSGRGRGVGQQSVDSGSLVKFQTDTGRIPNHLSCGWGRSCYGWGGHAG